MVGQSARARLDACLTRIADPTGEGARAFVRLYEDEARVAAAAADAREKFGHKLGPLDGVIVSIKDLFDVGGEPTTAGSFVYRDGPVANNDAEVVRRLRAAGAVIIGKTNMTEFAFSGLGLNPHYGTPLNPHDRARIPGGSTSGGAVALGDAMCDVSIGSDTGGSLRIPAAFCGLVGFKPTQSRVPRQGATALSYTLDSVGPLTRTVAEAATVDACLANDPYWTPQPRPVGSLRLGMPLGRLFEKLDALVTDRFEATVRMLLTAGAAIEDLDLEPYLARLDAINAHGSFSAVEAAHVHARVLEQRSGEIDRRIVGRIRAGSSFAAPEYVRMKLAREAVCDDAARDFGRYDALILPTVATVAPHVAPLEASDAAFSSANSLTLRNTSPFNMLDCCAISIPIRGAALPVGLMLVGARGTDRRLFDVAAGLEAALATI